MTISEAQDTIAGVLHESTSRIRRVIAALAPASSEHAAGIATPEQMSELLSELMRAGQCLRILPLDRNENLTRKVQEYRGEVERLRALLPALQNSLLSERARLEHDGERLQRAALWAQASGQILK